MKKILRRTFYHEIGVVGDQLTVERGVNCMLSMANGFSQDDRLEGIHVEIADWHAEMNFLGASSNCSRTSAADSNKPLPPPPSPTSARSARGWAFARLGKGLGICSGTNTIILLNYSISRNFICLTLKFQLKTSRILMMHTKEQNIYLNPNIQQSSLKI